MAFTKIEPSDLLGKGVVGLPDSPGLTATQMQEKFDEIALDVIVPKFNNVCDELDTFEGDYNGEKTQLETQIASLKQEIANLRPNLIPFPYADGTSKTINGITFTVDKNGVVDANGTSTGDAYFVLSYNVPLTNGETYRLGVPTSDMSSSHFVQAHYADWSNYYSNIPNDQNHNVPFVFDGSKSMHIRAIVPNGRTANHVKFYPMLINDFIAPTKFSRHINNYDMKNNSGTLEITSV